MKKISFAQKRYVFPLFFLPLILILIFVYGDEKEEVKITDSENLQASIAPPSNDVVKKEIQDKLTTYRENFRNADGYTAVDNLNEEDQEQNSFENLYSTTEKLRLDSIREANKFKSRSESISDSDRELIELLNGNGGRTQKAEPEKRPIPKEDPLKLMRQQYALLDSFQKANNPDYQILEAKQKARMELEKKQEQYKLNRVSVYKSNKKNLHFNTITAENNDSFIKAIIDEQIKVYAGSRVRIRLLEDVFIDNILLPQGAYLYAIVDGFSTQRLTFTITSIMMNNKIYPVELKIYDLDGLPGLYVPASAFREFTKELGGNSFQGMNMSTSTAENQSQFLMSTAQRFLQSTSQAVSRAVMKNKARLKYSTYIYLVDNTMLDEATKQNNPGGIFGRPDLELMKNDEESNGN
ncbi:MAG: conjugative transposon protein TraM [Prolixibacteraceae bacterium]|nr:conjugative transposon protein TraM [Prolixibacteraceae bacterium]